MNKAMLAAATAVTLTPYSLPIDEPKVIIRLIDHSATASGDKALTWSLPDLRTAASYTAQPTEALVNSALDHLKGLSDFLPPIDEELEGLVDSLVDASYASAEVMPLLRSV